jgi:hypothetical protein
MSNFIEDVQLYMMDFTINEYKRLLSAFVKNGYNFQTFSEYLENPKDKVVILRHDVDRLPNNSLEFAQIQRSFNVKGVYYFRAVPESWDETIIRKIDGLGHEIGYHYENMDTCKGDYMSAWDDFRMNLKKLREITNVKTICMHGSPMSKFDNKHLWKRYDYKSVGISGEPYFDIDFRSVFYLTDTGRRWDGWRFSIRDKVPQQEKWIREGKVFRKTREVIAALESGEFPNKVMLTMHPERWNHGGLSWLKNLLVQKLKNVLKAILVKAYSISNT